ncbi:hypothetical protein A3I18_02085 [Candidatus Campbellbacteria bacterium RIFCSPLOWO2_02_FULL_35_11]|uniref:Uncharacterized protein n=1 Tax=Candidatus Campbellbacteria bacterium RIFCSPLOWO2_02_FULL_35_11 TaxID=1797581 RepID=A0A1F5ET37_9BACT|nr:MAG: hypothetical protein A3I18_02085 [Candidatus Campbellbacteria bacterium RIFCSPLOWO2_02_FULL_35_11]OGH65906.1 MAG: hypothetical protein A3B83_05005 [Candidatus Magasanikbacteria bacterium RIFCSPHIGHO2_02_FULL_33_17]
MKYLYQFILILIVVVGVSAYFDNQSPKNVLAEESGDVSGCTVTIQTKTGASEAGKDIGRNSGCRPTFHFKMSGNAYCPNNHCVVDIKCENGDAKVYEFENPGESPDPCPPGANWNYPNPSPGRYPPVYGDMDFFLWKSRGGSSCILAIFLPKDLGTGECEVREGVAKSPEETLRDIIAEWKKLREELHLDVSDAMAEREDIITKMEEIRKEALDYSNQHQYCGGDMYLGDGTDEGFTRYSIYNLQNSTTTYSRLLLCQNSPRMKSCVGFAKDQSLDKGRESFFGGIVSSAEPLTITCVSTEDEEYKFDIPDGRESYPMATSSDMCDK